MQGTDVTVKRIPRSREVGQSYLTSVWTTLVALFAAISIVWSHRPDLVSLHSRISACAAELD